MICHWLTNNHNTISMCFWKYWELQVSTKSNRENLKFGDCFVITTLHSNPSIWGHLVTRSWFQNMPRCLHLYHEFNEFLSLNIGREFMTILKGDGPHEVASSHMLTWQSQTEQPMEKPMKKPWKTNCKASNCATLKMFGAHYPHSNQAGRFQSEILHTCSNM